ncbi:UDP-N-acetylmuramoyl-tripeptide--D-alanyl-D-alanine ligase [Candidatus Gracilibacteria bacterium]|nr:UDP-N-acetylmuramoyl-tripeptide--D-alanyl-D-alanine ligase [Candidatus Gracilibacteria bacterium]
MKKILLKLLQISARKVIEKHKPIVIGITGTVGKTTTTHFIYEFMSSLFGDSVYMSPYDYNGEYGLPLTVLQSKSPNRNLLLWILVFIKSFLLRFSKNYPKYLVLEYGIDHPGEMDFILGVAKPDYGIILNISENHLLQFPHFEDYVNEKLKLPLNSKNIIYNKDDIKLNEAFSKNHHENLLSFGISSKNADLVAFNIVSDINNLKFDLEYKGHVHSLKYNLIGEFQTYNILPAFALGAMLGVEIEKIKEIMSNINPQKGRGVLLKGANNSIIIDGSYNGGCVAIGAGIGYMDSLEGDFFKILFLGDMRELGDESKKLHLQLANRIINSKIDKVVIVGEEMKKYAYEDLVKHLGEENVSWFMSSRQAGRKIREIIASTSKQSVIFVKGSQNTIFLEEGIKEFLYDIRDASKLCRQGHHWMKKKDDFFNNAL